jgi:hypothetical protein
MRTSWNNEPLRRIRVLRPGPKRYASRTKKRLRNEATTTLSGRLSTVAQEVQPAPALLAVGHRRHRELDPLPLLRHHVQAERVRRREALRHAQRPRQTSLQCISTRRHRRLAVTGHWVLQRSEGQQRLSLCLYSSVGAAASRPVSRRVPLRKASEHEQQHEQTRC